MSRAYPVSAHSPRPGVVYVAAIRQIWGIVCANRISTLVTNGSDLVTHQEVEILQSDVWRLIQRAAFHRHPVDPDQLTGARFRARLV